MYVLDKEHYLQMIRVLILFAKTSAPLRAIDVMDDVRLSAINRATEMLLNRRRCQQINNSCVDGERTGIADRGRNFSTRPNGRRSTASICSYRYELFTGRLPWQPDGIKFTQCVGGQKISIYAPAGKTMRWIEKRLASFRIVTTFCISMQSLGRSNYVRKL